MKKTPDEKALERIQNAVESEANELDLSGLSLKSVPPEIVKLQKVTSLNLGSNQLTNLPNEITQLQKLTSLNISDNRIVDMPNEITQFQNLTSLNISGNRIADIPNEINQLQTLTTLDISRNQLIKLPIEIVQLQRLTSLNVSDNRLINMSNEIIHLPKLTSLSISGIQLNKLPSEITQLQNLTMLNISRNQLTRLPSEITQLQNLTTLNISGNQLTELPNEITQLHNLTSLNISGNQLTELPNEITQLHNLTTLNISGNQLTGLPNEITQLQNLTLLNVSHNQLTNLPNEITQLQNLTLLNVSHNRLTNLPNEIAQLQNLTSLDISHNQLTNLPSKITQLQNLTMLSISGIQLIDLSSEIAQLHNLTSLDISGNQLTDLPNEITQLQNLTSLDISGNQLTKLPSGITQLQNLTKLNVSGIQLNNLPNEIAQLQNLTSLDISRNQLTGLPNEIIQLQNLTSLDISRNQFINLPNEITQLHNLTKLYLSGNRLTDMPNEINQLQNLTSLEISGNQLTKLPSGITQLQNLTMLNVSHNQLTNLPNEIIQLQNLTSLDISGNQLTDLSIEITQLQSLTYLEVSDNYLTDIPSDIKNLQNLIILDLGGNKITTLSLEVTQLKHLVLLGIGNNNLNNLPIEINNLRNLIYIFTGGNPLEIAIPQKWVDGFSAKEIMKYYKKLHEEGGCPLGEARVLVVGEANAGKTKLIRGLLFDEYGEKFKDSRTPTDGIEVTLNEEEGISLRFWDFGGQEMMHSTHTFFLSQRCVYVLLADSTENPDQIEEKIESWLERIQVYGKNSPVILVASKLEDMPFSINERRLKEKYPNLVLPEAIRTSTKTGRGINDLRHVIFEQAKKLPTLNVPLPRSFLAVKDELERMKSDEKVKTIEEADYRRVCQANGVDEEERQNTLLQLLHDMGVVFHYEDPRLNHFAIFNPNWATGAVYKVITSLQVNDSHGRFSLEGLKEILKDEDLYPASMHPRIVDLMQFFELIYELHGKRDHYILPSSLNKEQPILKEWDVPAMKFEYHYKPALLISVLHRFIVAQHDYVDERFLWYSGVVLNYKDNRVLIQADTRAKCIIIKIIGEEKTRKELLYAIRMEFDRIHGEIKPEENIYPPEYPNLRLNFSHMKTMSETENEFKTVYNEKTVSINLRSLLEGFVTEEERKKDEERRRNELGIKEGQVENLKQSHQINNYYAPVIHGDVEGDNVSVGNQNQIAQSISNANLAPEMKETLLQLNEAIKQILPALTEIEAKKTEKHLKRLVEEVKESEPDREWYSVSIEGLIKAAENLNDLGKPVISLAGKVLKLLSPLP
ncbi:MAG: leucine-rich repeat domain-containing protein [Anaerolineae bacterium]|nr:leucine-rich repeat domain-containing protein [Anaerolineae bacterium]